MPKVTRKSGNEKNNAYGAVGLALGSNVGLRVGDSVGLNVGDKVGLTVLF